MTLQRVLTALVLLPVAGALGLWAPLPWVAIAFGLVIVLALLEYFTLGQQIGHRGYRLWTCTCALGLVFVQFLTTRAETFSLAGGLFLERNSTAAMLTLFPFLFVVFVLGAAGVVLPTPRPPLVNLPSFCLTASRLLFVVLPLRFCSPPSAMPRAPPRLPSFV